MSRPARTNPFRTERIEALAFRLEGTSWPDLLGRFDSLGLLPTLYEHRTSTELLTDLVAELIGTEARPCHHELARLFEAHGGNVRECLRELYDRWADLPSPRLMT